MTSKTQIARAAVAVNAGVWMHGAEECKTKWGPCHEARKLK